MTVEQLAVGDTFLRSGDTRLWRAIDGNGLVTLSSPEHEVACICEGAHYLLLPVTGFEAITPVPSR